MEGRRAPDGVAHADEQCAGGNLGNESAMR